jgi:hypothetical protein
MHKVILIYTRKNEKRKKKGNDCNGKLYMRKRYWSIWYDVLAHKDVKNLNWHDTNKSISGFTIMDENLTMASSSKPHLESPEMIEVHEMTSGEDIESKIRQADTKSFPTT